MKLNVAVGDAEVFMSAPGPYSPDVLDDMARQAGRLLAVAVQLDATAGMVTEDDT